MTTRPKIFTSVRIVAFTIAAILLYLIWRGPERFCYESFGTLIVSPEIYTRVLPSPVNHWLLGALIKVPVLSYVLYAFPVLMLLGSLAAGIFSIRRNSIVCAYACLFLAGTVFGVYHLLQPLGITFRYL
ncbi:hypothetical protein BH09VER1_BH09VER1_19420 [soil metagenome]